MTLIYEDDKISGTEFSFRGIWNYPITHQFSSYKVLFIIISSLHMKAARR